MVTRTIRELCSEVIDCPHSSPAWTESGKIVIRNTNIKNGRIDFSKPSFTDDEHFKARIRRVRPTAGDIVITREAPMGDVGIIPDGVDCCLGQRMVLLRPNTSVCDNHYLLYCLQSPSVQHQISWSDGTGTTVSNLRIPHLEALKIPFVPLEKQREVSAILTAIDEKIVKNEAINHHLERMAQAIFTELCSEGKSAVLSDILTVCYGKDHKRLSDGQIPCYGSGGIMRYVDKPLYTGESVLIPRKGSLNNVLYVNEAFWTVDTMFYTQMTHPNVAKLAYFIVRNLDLAGMNVGSAVPSMTTTVLNSLEIVLPSDETLARFEDTVSPMFLQMQANNEESERLAKLRDALLPRLMSGELSVTEAAK